MQPSALPRALRAASLLALLGLAAVAHAGTADVFADDFERTAPVGEPPGLVGTTAAHNAVRRGLGLPDLAWSPALAATAQAWASQCRDVAAPAGLVDHSTAAGRSAGYPWYVGENLFGSSGSTSGVQATNSWAAEAANYDYASNTCAPGRMCGHYTQIVWRSTAFVGCAYVVCPTLQYGHTIVCNYGPGGNTGGRPY